MMNETSTSTSTLVYEYNYDNHTLVQLPEEEISSFQSMPVVFYSLIICISLPGNSFLLWVVLKKVGLSSSADCLLLHLTVSDLIFTFALIPWTVYNAQGWIFGEPACKMFSHLIFLGLYSYMMLLTVMSVHRYIEVVYPVFVLSAGNRIRRYTQNLSTLAWLISMGFSLPEMIHSVTEKGYDGDFCFPKYSSKSIELFGYLSQTILFFLLPFLVIAFCYMRMGFVIYQSRFQSRNRHHAVCIILSIAVGFFICWAPYNVFLLYYSLISLGVNSVQTPRKNEFVYSVTHILAYSHCCLNPLIHIFGRKKFRRFLPCSRFRRSNQHVVSGQTHL